MNVQHSLQLCHSGVWLSKWVRAMWWLSYAVIAAALFVVGGIGARATDVGPWYRQLNKPSWNPPDWAFPIAWTTIYLFIIVSVGRVWNLAEPDQQMPIVIAVSVNLVLNMLWSVFFFAWRKPSWALIEVIALWLSIAAMMIVFYPVDVLATLLLTPYILWVSIASLLNLSIIRLNPDLRQVADSG